MGLLFSPLLNELLLMEMVVCSQSNEATVRDNLLMLGSWRKLQASTALMSFLS